MPKTCFVKFADRYDGDRNVRRHGLGWVLLMLLFLFGNSRLAADDQWTTDIEAAIQHGETDGKSLLLLFTGSDWCPPCKKLEAEVLSQEGFLREATQDFVLVKFDFPKQKKLPAALAEQNQQWAQKYGISGYPTVVLIDSKQRPFQIMGYEEGGVDNYLGSLGLAIEKRKRRDEALAKAQDATGEERAKLLDQALGEMSEDIAQIYYEDIVAEIVAIDKEDQLGLRTKWNSAKDSEMRKIIMTDIMFVSRLDEPQRAVAFIDEVLQEFQFPIRQKLQILQIKLNLLKSLKATDKMDSLLDSIIAMDDLTDETRQRMIVKKVFLMVGTDRRTEAMNLLEQSIRQNDQNGHLWLAKGQLLDADGQFAQAVAAFDSGLSASKENRNPDLVVELVGGKADSLMAQGETQKAIQALDAFAEDTDFPADLRGDALLQKSIIMRETKRQRQARLAENRAIELANSPAERAEMQKLVERLRKKYEK